jgi:hypothetical protein
MTKDSISEYDTNPLNNTDIGGISIEGNANVANFDNALSQNMAHLKDEHNAVYSEIKDNKVINGAFNINQRNVSGTVTLAAGEYGHDQWKAGSSGCSYTFATVNNVTTITIISGSLQQIIEGVYLYDGTYCLGWSGTAQGKINAGSYSSSGVTGVATGGTNLTVEFNTGTLSKVILISGDIEGVFRGKGAPQELLDCQPYYVTVSANIRAYASASNQVFENTAYWPATMRGTPSVNIKTSGSAQNTSSVNLFNPTNSGVRFNLISAASGDAYAIHYILEAKYEL